MSASKPCPSLASAEDPCATAKPVAGVVHPPPSAGNPEARCAGPPSPEAPRDIRVAVVDPDIEFWRRFGRALCSAGGILLVGRCSTSAEALARIPFLKADVILVEDQLRDTVAHECVAKVTILPPRRPIAMLTSQVGVVNVVLALLNGAQGYLLKSDGPVSIAGAIKELHEGHPWFSASVQSALVEQVVRACGGIRPTLGWSPRQLEVFAHRFCGESRKSTAAALGCATETVHAHERAIYAALDAHCWGEAKANFLTLSLADAERSTVPASAARLGPNP